MQCLVVVTSTKPLNFHFSLYNPQEDSSDSDGAVYVPRLLAPLGTFVSVQVTRADGQVVYESARSKIKLKLDPSKSESYYALDPGYSYGIVLEVEEDDMNLPPGEYQMHVVYSNLQFQGFAGHHIGEMSYHTTLPLRRS